MAFLDLKKQIAKITNYIDLNKKQTLTFTATTNNDGAASIPNFNRNYSVVNASVTNYANGLCIPFLYDNRIWFVKVVEWQNMSADVANKSLNFVIEYKVGGVARKLLKALQSLTSERGWAVC